MSAECLSIAEVESYHLSNRWRHGSSGEQRFYCPSHGGDNQRSLSVREDGVYNCHSCGAKGKLREFWTPLEKSGAPTPRRSRFEPPTVRAVDGAPPPENPTLGPDVLRFAEALPGSWGQQYLERRRIPIELAARVMLGYAAAGTWPNPERDWKFGRVVFPHSDPFGLIVSLYGRAVGSDDKVPKWDRHDHLPGPKGVFNGEALNCDTVFLTEGAFDALALMAAGVENVTAIFGLNNVYWPWVHSKSVVFAFDHDERGLEGRAKLSREAIIRGKNVYYLPQDVYQGQKDLAETWRVHGCIEIPSELMEET